MAIILITGASSGIGYQTAELLAQNGHKVYGAARRMDKLEKLKSVGVEPIYLDITNEESCRKLVDTIIDNEGQIDILINNAGYGSYGAIEDVPLEEAKRQFEVNLFGLAALTKLVHNVLPNMLCQFFGRTSHYILLRNRYRFPLIFSYSQTIFHLVAANQNP